MTRNGFLTKLFIGHNFLLEAIVGSRQNSEKRQTSTNESILSMLLTEMDGVGTSKFEASRSNDGISGAVSGTLVLI